MFTQAQFGRRWTKVAKLVGSRSVLQVKSYARQYFKQKVRHAFSLSQIIYPDTHMESGLPHICMHLFTFICFVYHSWKSLILENSSLCVWSTTILNPWVCGLNDCLLVHLKLHSGFTQRSPIISLFLSTPPQHEGLSVEFLTNLEE